MAFDKVWVVAEYAETGKPTTVTYELLTKAREVAGTVEAFTHGDASTIAEDLGRYGASKVYTTGDLGGSLVGVPVAAAIAAQVQSGNAPDAILFAQDYD